MQSGDETTDDSVKANVRNFYKVELWTRDDFIERLLFAGTSLDRARVVFADCARHRPEARLTIRQRSRVLTQWPKHTGECARQIFFCTTSYQHQMS
jgi:hypothetical protein